VKSSKAQILTKLHKIPEIQFEDQQLKEVVKYWNLRV